MSSTGSSDGLPDDLDESESAVATAVAAATKLTVPDIESGRGYLVLHRVECSRQVKDGWDHSEHHNAANYLDRPRLYANDTRGSSLRGLNPIGDWTEYWEDHPEYHIVIFRHYDCDKHHAAHANEFHLVADGFEKSVLRKLSPWLHRLKSTTAPATRKYESIKVSKSFSAAVTKLAEANQPHLGRWDPAAALVEPYDYFYHFRRRLRAVEYTRQLTTYSRKDLLVLLDFIDEVWGSIFDEIDRTFLSGNVQLNMFDKLFGPNELVVTSQNGVARALIAEKAVPTQVPGHAPSISLECWSWAFDGSFRKKTEILYVRWPTLSERVIGMDRLSVQPLRVDKTGLRERLQQRGRKFWASRHKSLVCYNPPTPTTFELQIVGILLDR